MLSAMRAARAVVFDMDGVLVDSWRAHFESWRTVCRERGRELSEAEFAAGFGRTSREVLEGLFGPGALSPQEIAELDRRKEALYRRMVEHELPVVDGAVELAHELARAGFALAVGSSGPPENVELVVERTGLRPLLGAIVTGADVARGKPDPEIFLTAARRLGIPARRCAVIEDAPVGIRAARAAGMLAIGFSGTGRPAAELAEAGADLVVGSLRELSADEIAQRLDARQQPPACGNP